ncbi:NADP-dependent oxidoreductase domain-containing protein [Boletus reticuloceps]|uniref:NADP-dependent oxidoreductase domain-containing protein n=1 Tax=Boletus reticuloceps TaxID=495285 RepID=A0A8I3AFX5_9AGAM|nr:NADP-dependent oxidoreductase domain-containing protein [Boletus reticuloceps]
MSSGKALPLNTGKIIPQIGLGTWLSKPNEVENAVEIAVRNGYRHLDLARIYQNQDEVGRALKKVIPSVVSREELFITSKLWNSCHQPQLVEAALDETLQQLGLTYLDLYLIHWPVAFKPGKTLLPVNEAAGELELDTETSLVDTWKAMMKLRETGKVKAIGVSNFTISQLQGIIDATGVVPAANQVEAHPLLPQDDLVAYCAAKSIHLTAYSPLGNNLVGVPMLTEHPVVQTVAKSLDATPAQVLIAWGVYRGYSVIPKSVHEGRIISNFKQVELSKEDYEKVTAIGHGNSRRYNTPVTYKPKWNIKIFDEDVEKRAVATVKIA